MVPRVSQRDRDIAFCRQHGLLGHINHLRWHRRLYVIGGYVEDDPYLQLGTDTLTVIDVEKEIDEC
jgi:hypothetical protein